MNALFSNPASIFFLPFPLFRYAKEFDICERDAVKLQDLKNHYSEIMKRLETLQDSGEIDEFTRRAIIDMTKEVTRHLAEHFTNVKEGVESIMGGKILNYEAKDILNRGRNEGRAEGIEKGIEKGRAEGKSDMVLELLRTKQPLDFIAKVSKFSVERIAEIGKMNGIPV